MHVLETEQFIFYTAGKIGTRTLLTVPGIRDVSRNEINSAPLRRRNLQLAIQRKEVTGKPVVAVVREPISRLHSGLFEIIAKIASGTFIQEMEKQNADISFLEDISFWSRQFERCIKMSPRIWIPDKEFDSHRWQYHVGNWLPDVETISETFEDTIILNLHDLSKFLNSNGIEFTYTNKFTNVLSENSSGNPAKIYQAFKNAVVEACQRRDYIEKYLEPEISSYNNLINKTQYYVTGN
jgi:hypothetical protein